MVGKFEIRKDTAQVIAESAATHVGRIATILAGTVREVTHEFGEWATDVFEMREAASEAERVRRASDAGDDSDDGVDGVDGVDEDSPAGGHADGDSAVAN